MEIIDCHTHIFPPEIIRRREEIVERDVQFALIYKNSKERLIDATVLLDYMKENNITKAVALSFPFKDKGLTELSNEYILEMAKVHKNIIPFVVMDPLDEKTTIKELEGCITKGAKGIGEIGFYDSGLGINELKKLKPIAELANSYNIPIMIHINEPVGHIYNGKIKVDFVALTEFILKQSETKFILAHLGGGLCFYEFMPEIKEGFKNVFYDTAALPFLYSKEIYNYLGTFLKEKVLLGTDYPLLGIKRYLKNIEPLDVETRACILYKNAGRLFGRN